MIDPTYTTEALAWSVVWIGAGLTFRRWLAAKAYEDARRRQLAGRR